MADGLFRQERSYAEFVTGLGHDATKTPNDGDPSDHDPLAPQTEEIGPKRRE